MSVLENKYKSIILEYYSQSTLAQESHFQKISLIVLLLSITPRVYLLEKGNIGGVVLYLLKLMLDYVGEREENNKSEIIKSNIELMHTTIPYYHTTYTTYHYTTTTITIPIIISNYYHQQLFPLLLLSLLPLPLLPLLPTKSSFK
jgi:hypothetical protein